jgi:hypothetical protein
LSVRHNVNTFQHVHSTSQAQLYAGAVSGTIDAVSDHNAYQSNG